MPPPPLKYTLKETIIIISNILLAIRHAMREHRGVTLHMPTDIEPLIGPSQYMLQSHIAVKKIKQVRLVKGQNLYAYRNDME